MANYRGPFRHIAAIRCLGQAHGLASPLLPDPLVNGDFEDFYPAAHLGESPRNWRSEARLNANAASITAGNLPGRYSGEMRRVVQDLLGRGATIPWSYSAATTHGLYTSGDVDVPTRNAGAATSLGHEVIPYAWGNGWVYVCAVAGTTGAGDADAIAWPTTEGATVVDGTVTWEALRPWTPKWLIQIANTGIHAYPLSINGANTETERILDYIPLSTPFPSLADPDVVELADAAAVAAPYALAPLFGECGWAFSASGAKAGHVLWGEVSDYWHTTLYEIAIGGEVDGAPGSATVTEVDDGTFWGPDDNVKLKYPDYSASVLISREPDNGNPTLPPAGTAPVHCWYSGETRQDVTYHWAPGTAISDTAGNNNWSGHEGRQHGYASPVLSAPPLVSWITGVEEVVTDLGVVLGYQRGLRFREIAARRKDITTYTDGKGVDMVDVLAVPFNDRESVYHSRQERDTDEGTFERRIRWVHGNWYGDNPDPTSPDLYVLPNDNAYKDQHPEFVDCSSGVLESVQCSEPAFDRLAAGLTRWSTEELTGNPITLWDLEAIDPSIAYGGNIAGCGGGFSMDFYGSTPEAVFAQLLPETATLRHTGKEVRSVSFSLCPANAYRLCYETSDDGGLTWNPEICTHTVTAWPARALWVVNQHTVDRADFGDGETGPSGTTTVTRTAGAALTGTTIALTLDDTQWTAMKTDNYPPSPANQLLNVVPDANAHAQSIYSAALDTAGWITKATTGDYPAGASIEIHSAFVGKP